MKTFKITADAIFEAENISHAFERLERHFKRLSIAQNEARTILEEGHITIKPVEKK